CRRRLDDQHARADHDGRHRRHGRRGAGQHVSADLRAGRQHQGRLSLALGAAPRSLTPAAPLARRLAWVTAARLVLLSLLLGLLGLLNFRAPLAWATFTVQTALATLAVAFGVTALYAALLRDGRHMQRLVVLQLVVDPVLWTVI